MKIDHYMLSTLWDPIVVSLPVFAVFVLLDAVSAVVLDHEQADTHRGYDRADARTSVTMGLGFLSIMAFWRLVMIVVYVVVGALSPLHLSASDWWTWLIAFFVDDLCWYVYHRCGHRIRFMWAGHQVHHSSPQYNFSTALRQKWSPFFSLPFWLPAAVIGIPAWMILTMMSANLVFQFFVHTERVGRLWRPIELIFNTPSHHRVHHGSDEHYLDRNYAGVLIVWDRLFGTFQPEIERPTYGLTTGFKSHRPIEVAFHEWASIRRDVKRRPHGASGSATPPDPPAGSRQRLPRSTPQTRTRS
jgi:sterol desaturase/sphingolipid hydroxylase (fatty acid hydroxylase superfamily)